MCRIKKVGCSNRNKPLGNQCTRGKESFLLPTEGKVLQSHTGCSRHNPTSANRLMVTAKPNGFRQINYRSRYSSALGQLQSLPRGQLITSFVRLAKME